jgi:hypothetical protein
MGKIDLNTLMISGKIGSIVAYTTKYGKQVYRKYTIPNDPKTPKQQAYRMRFGLVNKSLSPFNKIIKKGFNDQHNAYRSVISHMLHYGVEGEYPDFSINYSEIKVADGKLALPNNITATIDNDLSKLQLTWNPLKVSNSKYNSSYDNVNIVCFNDELQEAVSSFGLAKRGDGELEVDYINIFDKGVSENGRNSKPINPDNLHFWLYLTSRDYSINSISSYVNL